MQAIGDLANFLTTRRFQTVLQSSALTAAQEATNGVAENKAKHLGGATLSLSLLERKAALLSEHQRALSEASVFANGTQASLGTLQSLAEEVSESLSIVSQLQNEDSLAVLSGAGKNAFLDAVGALNTNIAGKYLFAGTATNTAPLANGADILDDIGPNLTTATTAADVVSALDLWFDTAGGDFETDAYLGSNTGFVTTSLGQGQTAAFSLRADDQSFRETLKALAMATFADDAAVSLPLRERKALLEEAQSALHSAKQMLIDQRSDVGLMQARIAEATDGATSSAAQTEIDRLTLVGIDQYEAVSRFEASQQQLDIFYQITARQNQVSLAGYLR